MEELADWIEREGWCPVPSCLSADEVVTLRDKTEYVLGDRAGMRSVLEYEWGRELATSKIARDLLSQLGYGGAFCVRGILFDKRAGANWKVPWHQDRKIAVKARREVEGFRAWSEKEGVAHCQPTPDVLEAMVTLRFHLDDCDETNGPLRVLPGTHSRGLIGYTTSLELADSIDEVTCVCGSGDVIAMKPLLLHTSSEAARVGHRRVLHFEFATTSLPGGLVWAWQV